MALTEWLSRLLAPFRRGPRPRPPTKREQVRKVIADANATTCEIRKRCDEERETLSGLRGHP